VHPLQLVESATLRNVSPPEVVFSKCGTSGFFDGTWASISLTPTLRDGTVEVAGEPVDEGVCRRDSHDEPFHATFQLSDTVGVPGGPVRVPFFVEADAAANGLSFSVDFDEGLLEATEIERVYRLPDGSTDYDLAVFGVDNANDHPGSGGVDEGFLAGGILFRDDWTETLPANQKTEVLAFHFRVKPEVPAGTTTEIQFIDGGRTRPAAQPVSNVMIVEGTSVEPGEGAAYLYLDGFMRIVPDVSVFVRGDSSGDRTVDLSDAVFTLGYLFLGSQAPSCLESCDANDDGIINVTDPIHLLQFLFLGAAELPPPFPECGGDGDAAGPGCVAYTRCSASVEE